MLITSRKFSKVIKNIIRFSEEIRKGNLDAKISTDHNKGEIKKLSDALNDMALMLNRSFKQITHERGELKAALSSMSEGVMLLSSNGKVILINNAIREMFQIKEDLTHERYWEIIRNTELNELIEDVLSTNTECKKEIAFLYPTEKHYLASVIPLDSPEKELVVVIFDITGFKSLEKIKADFIANVSHELRTPLTAIKGYTETLQEEAYESQDERKHFLNTINRHTDRLINIVSDLLVLSEIESKESSSKESLVSDFEKVDIREIISSSYDSLKGNTTEKNLKVALNLNEVIPITMGNRFLLEQMFINLVDNAVKYTPEGGTIGANASNQDSSIKIEIFDTGMGIPRENLQRIFERFYRVDKTRSRQMGGTGLGLSIVKHIANIHGAQIDVESEVGKGTKFIINFPLYTS
ncbi:ATP-binding protein [Desulfobacterota bacterium AH_259_B03_O07]|nr:ATP-binding protein [Desulfobacterota bacterium AH_259_B03_O07]